MDDESVRSKNPRPRGKNKDGGLLHVDHQGSDIFRSEKTILISSLVRSRFVGGTVDSISGSIVSLLCVAALNADGTMAVRGRVGSGRRWKE